MLPSLDGLEVCRRIRAQNRMVPILMLTARASIRDVVRGLETGADDYLTKPFSTAELMARVGSLLRRMRAIKAAAAGRDVPDKHVFIRGSLVIDACRHQVTVAGKPVALTVKEFDLLLLFARHPGRVYSRGELLDRIWGPDFEGFDHTVNTHINRLRAKV
jgi:DNA-binding response OmpR family regulator